MSFVSDPGALQPPISFQLEGAFDDFFRQPHPGPAPGSLADTRDARGWFEILQWGVKEGLYSFQQPIEARDGPRIRIGGRWFLSLSAYDYLGLLDHPAIVAASEAALRAYGAGSGGVRLLTGTLDLHHELERDLATFKGTQAALVVGSGYLANLAVLASVLSPRDRVILDACAHRSIVDGCRLAGSELVRFPHNDLEGLERLLRQKPRHASARTLIVSEGLYSMDGDVCPLPGLVDLKRRYGAFLMVDEAHSLGVLGPRGGGVNDRFGLPAETVDVWTGSLSKAIPSGGGFIAAARDLIIYLQHAAAPYIFSAAVSPAAAAAARAALAVIRAEPERCRRARDNATRLRRGLADLGYDTGRSEAVIIPIMLGPRETAYRAARTLHDLGVAASAVTYPAVAPTASRLRLCATAHLTPTDIDTALEALQMLRESSEAVAAEL